MSTSITPDPPLQNAEHDGRIDYIEFGEAGGIIVKPPFSFPGGRRFHFMDPSGNELAVWSDR